MTGTGQGLGSGRWRLPAALAVAVLCLWLALIGLPDGRLHVYFLDVGQGDAILFATPDGRQVLVDGGPSPTTLMGELGDVLPFWDRSLDLVILTHPDADHMAGLLPLFERYHVAQVMDAAEDSRPWNEVVGRAGASRSHVAAGQRFTAGGIAFEVLNPPALNGFSGMTENDRSIVLRAVYGERSFLLTGDAGEAVEAQLMAGGAVLHADVLKVGHHGSDSASSPAFIAAIAPSLAVIQVGEDNDFGHPHPAVLARLAGRPVLRTDQAGRIEVISDGTRLWVRTARSVTAGLTPDSNGEK